MLERIVRFSLENRLLVSVLGLLVMAGGAWSFTRLPVDAFPDVSPNLVQVFTVTEGLAPEEVERYVTYPVEIAMNGLPGVQHVRSVSNFGLSVVNVYFEDDIDIYFARQVVGERLREARERIPSGFGEPEMGPISTGMGQVLFYYLEDTTGSRSLEELRALQDWVVKFHLQTVPGVTEVLGIGGHERQFHVVVHPEELQRYDVSLEEVIHRIRANNLNVGAQFLERNDEELVVRSVGLATGIEDLSSIVVRTEAGRPVTLSDVAEITTGGALRRGLQTRNGSEEVVAGMVIKLFGANSSTVIGAVEEKLAGINRTLPEGVRIVPYYEQKSLVRSAVNTVTLALLQGVALVGVVLFAFMGGLRPSLVVAATIPFAVLFAFFMMERLGISANLMSLGGLAIAIGILVDGAIVTVENVERTLRESSGGDSRLRIVRRACVEVVRPIAFSVTIVIVVFLPLFTLQGVEGKMFRPLAYTVALALLGSLIFALLFVPALSSVVMRSAGGKPGRRLSPAGYRKLVAALVRRRWIAVLLGLILLAAGSLVAPRLGSEFTPRLREGTIVVRLTMAPSISLEASRHTTLIAERRLLQVPEIREVVSRVGRGEVGAHTDPVNSAEMFVTLAPRGEWREGTTQASIEESIRASLEGMPGVLINLTQPIEMTVDELLEGVRAELAVKVFGEDPARLQELAEEIAAGLRSIEGAADVQVDQGSGTPQVLIRVDREAIARYGLNVEDVQSVVSAAVGGEVVGEIFEGVRRTEILVRYEARARSTVEAIRRILVNGPGDQRIPLDELTTVTEIVGPRQITREDGQRFVAIQCNVVGRDIGGFVREGRGRIDEAVDLPPGYLVTWGGQYRLQQEANARFAVVVPVTLLLVFLLLFGSFGSVRSAALILLNIPLALVGGIAALGVGGLSLSVPASVGFIALFGIALGNGMVMLSTMNRLVREGRKVAEAAIEGAALRLRPVLMTALTTGLGLIPLLLATGTGSEVQRPLATVVLGGLVTSTALTLLVIPALYPWFSDARAGGREEEH